MTNKTFDKRIMSENKRLQRSMIDVFEHTLIPNVPFIFHLMLRIDTLFIMNDYFLR